MPRAIAFPGVLAALTACAPDRLADRTPPLPLGEPQIEYPVELFSQGVSGTVQLRLFVDSSGTVVSDSTRVATSSGYAAFDSAARAAAPSLRYTPATRGGRPIATAFLQPVHFRHPAASDSTT